MNEGILSKVRDRLIVALDLSTSNECLMLASALRPYAGTFKLGVEAISAEFVSLVAKFISACDRKVFVDTKYNDMPDRVTAAIKKLPEKKAAYFTIHLSAPDEMIVAALDAGQPAIVLGVTVLSCFKDSGALIKFGSMVGKTALRFALNFKALGGRNIVCTPRELELFSQHPELNDVNKFVVGIRPRGSPSHDHNQERIMTPKEALLMGARALIIGRPIIYAPNPIRAAEVIAMEMAEVL